MQLDITGMRFAKEDLCQAVEIDGWIISRLPWERDLL